MKAFSRTPLGRRHGRCYELASRYVLQHEDAVLVYGTVAKGFEPGRMNHAWCELDDGATVYDPTIECLGDTQEYAQRHEALPLQRLDQKAMARRICDEGHWGPWD